MPGTKPAPGAKPEKPLKNDSRLVYRERGRFRVPVALIIFVVWAIMVAVLMNVRTFVATGGNAPNSETGSSETSR